MSAAIQLRAEVGTAQACDALGIPRATFFRKLKPPVAPPRRPAPPLALSDQQRQAVLDLLHCERFQDEAPRQVFAVLLDEGRYHCSVRTMYRILKKEYGEVKERRRHVQRLAYEKPELLATRANEVWSWDITKLLGPAKWTYFYLYVIMDIFSRYVVGWMVAHRESAGLAKKLIEETCQKQRIVEGWLTVHADRGSPMTSKCLVHVLSDPGIVKTHSRPHVSNDNPYSKAHFKTLKYCPQFPGRFGSIQDARSFCREFFAWYNQEHRHSGIGLVTPEQLHYGLAAQVVDQRRQVLKAALQANSARFKGKTPQPPALPTAAWINKPASDDIRV